MLRLLRGIFLEPAEDDVGALAERADVAPGVGRNETERVLDELLRTNVRYDRTRHAEYEAALDAIRAALGRGSRDDVRHVLRTHRALLLHPALNAPPVPRECADTPEMEEVPPPLEQPAELESAFAAGDAAEADDFDRAWLELEAELAAALAHVHEALERDVRERTYLLSSLPEEGMFFSSFTLRCPRRIHTPLIEKLIAMYTEERARRECTPYLWTERPLYVGAHEEQLLTLAFRHLAEPCTSADCARHARCNDDDDDDDEPPPLEQLDAVSTSPPLEQLDAVSTSPPLQQHNAISASPPLQQHNAISASLPLQQHNAVSASPPLQQRDAVSVSLPPQQRDAVSVPPSARERHDDDNDAVAVSLNASASSALELL